MKKKLQNSSSSIDMVAFQNQFHEEMSRVHSSINQLLADNSFVLVKNCFSISKDNVLDTPDRLDWPTAPEEVIDNIRSLVKYLNVNLLSYELYGAGGLFQRVGPAGRSGKLKDLANRALGAHTDLPHLELSSSLKDSESLAPRITLLACVCGDPSVKTYVTSISTIINHLDHQEIELLLESKYSVSTPAAWEKPARLIGKACLLKVDGGYHVRCSPNLMHSKSLKHTLALEKLILIGEMYSSKMCLQEGDILVVNNYQALHGRSASQEQNSSRVLVRCYAA